MRFIKATNRESTCTSLLVRVPCVTLHREEDGSERTSSRQEMPAAKCARARVQVFVYLQKEAKSKAETDESPGRKWAVFFGPCTNLRKWMQHFLIQY